MTHNTGTAANAGRSSNWWLRAALLVSLMVNLVVLGAIAGTVWASRSDAEWRSSSQHAKLGLRIFSKNLPPARREFVVASIEKARQSLRPLREEVRQLRKDAGEALGAEPFDKERLKAEMVRLVEGEARLRSEVVKAFSEIVAQLTPEERRAYREWRQQQSPPLFGGSDEKDGEGKR
jgi:uncharacterized membrane protein